MTTGQFVFVAKRRLEPGIGLNCGGPMKTTRIASWSA